MKTLFDFKNACREFFSLLEKGFLIFFRELNKSNCFFILKKSPYHIAKSHVCLLKIIHNFKILHLLCRLKKAF